jgi:hypothetical protein
MGKRETFVAKYKHLKSVDKYSTFAVIATDLTEAKMMAAQFGASIIVDGIPVLSMDSTGGFNWKNPAWVEEVK